MLYRWTEDSVIFERWFGNFIPKNSVKCIITEPMVKITVDRGKNIRGKLNQCLKLNQIMAQKNIQTYKIDLKFHPEHDPAVRKNNKKSWKSGKSEKSRFSLKKS